MTPTDAIIMGAALTMGYLLAPYILLALGVWLTVAAIILGFLLAPIYHLFRKLFKR